MKERGNLAQLQLFFLGVSAVLKTCFAATEDSIINPRFQDYEVLSICTASAKSALLAGYKVSQAGISAVNCVQAKLTNH